MSKPPPPRNIDECIRVGKILHSLNDKGKEYDDLSKETGVTRVTVFYPLYRLYGFDFLHDACTDGMHTPCNYCKELALLLMSGVKDDRVNAAAETGEEGRAREQTRDTYVNHKAMLDKLEAFPATKEMKSGRFPTRSSITDALGFWKMEEYRWFGYPLMVHITADGVMRGNGGIFTSEVRHKTLLALSEIIRIHYHGGRDGWTLQDCEYYRRCLRFLLIHREEDPSGGLNVATINNHSLHTFCDYQTVNWGEPSNSSCWGRERKVKEFTEVPHNGKNIALSMTIAAVVAESLECDRDRIPTREEIHVLFSDVVGPREENSL